MSATAPQAPGMPNDMMQLFKQFGGGEDAVPQGGCPRTGQSGPEHRRTHQEEREHGR